MQLTPNRGLKSTELCLQRDEQGLGRFTCVLLLGCLWARGHTLVTKDVNLASLRGGLPLCGIDGIRVR